MTVDLSLNLVGHGLPGRLIIFSGCDGSGKSTLTRLALDIARSFGKASAEVDLLDDAVRTLREFRRYGFNPSSASSEIDLFALSIVCAGSRLQRLRSDVIPRLAEGQWVFCDRYIFTTWSEFNACRVSRAADDGLLLRKLLEVFPKPDCAFLAVADSLTCIERVSRRPEEAGKILDVAHYSSLIETYREVGRRNQLFEVATTQPFSTTRARITEELGRLFENDREVTSSGSRSNALVQA